MRVDPGTDDDAGGQRAEHHPMPRGRESGHQLAASQSNSVLAKRIFCSLPATTWATSSHSTPLAPGMPRSIGIVLRGAVTTSLPAWMISDGQRISLRRSVELKPTHASINRECAV